MERSRLELSRAIMQLVAASPGRPLNVDDMARQLREAPEAVRRQIAWLEDQGTLRRSQSTPAAGEEPTLRLFISHAHVDMPLAAALVELFVVALQLPAGTIRCSSVPGYKLEAGANTDVRLQRELYDAEAFVGLISSQTRNHAYVMFELGARWVTQRHFVPLLARGMATHDLWAPLDRLNALRLDDEPDLHQLVADVARSLRTAIQQPAVYLSALRRVVDLP